jgi:hypothetical protein
MSTLDSAHHPESDFRYLPDSRKGINRTRVYVRTQITEKLSNVEAALRYMRDELRSPIALRRVSPDGLTVVLEASVNPRILVGCELPSGDPVKDIQEILYVLSGFGIDGKIHY